MANPDPYRAPAVETEVAPPLGYALAQCPKCGALDAAKVSYNWWGGALGPRLFHVVKCRSCRTSYNGRTGAKLTRVIIAYQGVVLLVLLGAWLALRR